MDVSVKGEYALRAVFDLACRDAPDPTKIARIAERQKIPQKFLELILAQLKQAGYLNSKRGADGGYLLGRPADQITVGDILRVIDGPVKLSRRPIENESADSPFPEMWKRAERSLSSVIDRTTFADLVERWKQNRAKRVVNWEI